MNPIEESKAEVCHWFLSVTQRFELILIYVAEMGKKVCRGVHDCWMERLSFHVLPLVLQRFKNEQRGEFR